MPAHQRASRRGYRGIYPVTVPVLGAGTTTTIIGSSVRLCGWSVESTFPGASGIAASLAVAAAAAGTLTLTGFTAVSSVTVTPAAAWPAGVNQVTVSNITGGPVVADIPGGTENPVTLTFSPPAGVSGVAAVAVPAIVGGPAYTIEASGAQNGVPGAAGNVQATFLDGGQVTGQTAANAGLSDTQWLSDNGVYIGTGIAIKVTTGQLSGCIYVIDGSDWDPGY